MSVSIVYNFPFEGRVSHNLETGETTIYVTHTGRLPLASTTRFP